MDDEPGLRERKKARTRRALNEAAVRLFQEQGYEGTTVAQIAAAADVSTKTFFNYFAGKDDVIFAEAQVRIETALAVLLSKQPGETPADIISRMSHAVLAVVHAAHRGTDPRIAKARAQLVFSVPALRARGARLLLDAERELAEALHKAYPRALSPVKAAAIIGALLGAARAAIHAAVDSGASVAATEKAAADAFDLVLTGIRDDR